MPPPQLAVLLSITQFSTLELLPDKYIPPPDEEALLLLIQQFDSIVFPPNKHPAPYELEPCWITKPSQRVGLPV